MRPDIQEALTEVIPLIAKKVGRNFPSHIMDTEDFIQEGWAGALKVKKREEWSDEEFITQCRKAAWGRSIDAIRRFRDLRGCRDLEVIVEDIEHYTHAHTPTYDDSLDLTYTIKNLSLREKTVLWMLMAEYTLAEIGKKFNRTEAWACQIKTGLFAYLRTVL